MTPITASRTSNRYWLYIIIIIIIIIIITQIIIISIALQTFSMVLVLRHDCLHRQRCCRCVLQSSQDPHSQ